MKLSAQKKSVPFGLYKKSSRKAVLFGLPDCSGVGVAKGSGKISSSLDYPVRGRGGQGVMAMDKAMRGGALVASFPVEIDEEIMLATSTGQSIRCPVEGISFRSRSAGGVKVFDTGAGEEVVSVARIADQGEDGESDE